MFRIYLILLFSVFLLNGCSHEDFFKNKKKAEPTEEEMAIQIYTEAVEALQSGDAYYAGKKFLEVENMLPQSKWAAKASLMNGYAHYNRNAYVKSVFQLQRYIKDYPADENVSYAHYLIAICYYEQILDEKKDQDPLLRAKKKFEFIISSFPNSDYAVDARFKIDLIIDQLAAKEMYIARFYMETEKWIPAINRLKIIVKEYDKTIFIEEALHRLVEVYYKIGLIEEAQEAAAILGYNYQSSSWYERSYKVFNKKYQPKRYAKQKEMGLIRRKIKNLFK